MHCFSCQQHLESSCHRIRAHFRLKASLCLLTGSKSIHKHSTKLIISDISTQCCLPHSCSPLKFVRRQNPKLVVFQISHSSQGYPQSPVLFNITKCEYPGPVPSTPALLPLSLKGNWLFWKLESHSYSPDLHCRSQQVLVPPLSLPLCPSFLSSRL